MSTPANLTGKQALAYLFAQSPYVFPIVGVNTVEHVNAMPAAMDVKLTKDEVLQIQAAKKFQPLFPVDFLYNFRNDQPYHLGLSPADQQQYQMSAWINAPPKQWVSTDISLVESFDDDDGEEVY